MALPSMNLETRTDIQEQIAKQRTGRIENFFGSRDLLPALNKDGTGWGRDHRVALALEAANSRGDLDETLMAAVD